MKNVSRRQFIKGLGVGVAGMATAGILPVSALSEDVASENSEIQWDYEADVVVIGAGGAGLPAALKAMEDGASVLLVDSNWDAGGHASVSEGNLHNGAGISEQVKYGIQDSADLYYYDHTRGVPFTTRYNDRAVVRSVANAMHESYEFFLSKGLKVLEREPRIHDYYKEAINKNEPESVARQTYTDAQGWVNHFTGTSANGIGVTRPLEKTLRDQGARFLFNYHMNKIYREGCFSGKVLGIKAAYTPHIMPGQTSALTSEMSEGNIETSQESVNIKANKGIIIATGGSTGSVRFRTMFDPRLGPEFDGLAGMPFSDQDGSGEIAAMEIGGSLGDLAAYVQPAGGWIATPSRFGCQYGYGNGFTESSKVWPLVRANGIKPDFDSLVIVNMLGQRCGNEDKYNTSKYVEDRFEFLDTALSSVFIDPKGDGNAECFGGPLWAIFDADAVERNDWKMEQGIVDFTAGYAFKGDTLEELAQNIVNKYYEQIHMDAATLVDTIKRYNEAVETGLDEDWGKTSLGYKIEKGPFYAVWCMPSLHDTYAGLRTDKNMQVMDIYGEPIPNLFCAGESAGGMRIHGLGRVMTSGYIAGRAAASVDGAGIATSSTELNPAFAGEETSNLTKTSTRYDVTCVTAVAGEGDAKSSEVKTEGTTVEEGVQTFVGTSDKGIGGPIQVQISVKDGKMIGVEVLKQSETEGIGTTAFEPLIQSALDQQTSQLDSISGATITSTAFCEALQSAMEKAGL